MTQNYIVSSETGIEVNGTVYETGHVLNLNDEQVESEPFKNFIEDGSLTLEPEAGVMTAPVPEEDSADESPKDDAASSEGSGDASDAANTEGSDNAEGQG